MYHLKQLMAQKLVDKDKAVYRLSDAGLSYIDGFSFNTLKPRKQPKIICIMIIRNKAGDWLMTQRKYQPYIGQFSFASGKQHLGESPDDHAHRELREKLHLDIPARRRGLADIRIYHGETLITHVLAHLYQGEVEGDALPPDTHQYAFRWIADDDILIPMLAGTREIMEKLRSDTNDLFFISLDGQDTKSYN